MRLFGEDPLGPGPLENCFFFFSLFFGFINVFWFSRPPHPKTPVFLFFFRSFLGFLFFLGFPVCLQSVRIFSVTGLMYNEILGGLLGMVH